MNVGTLLFLILYILADRLIRKRFPGFCRKIELPANILFTAILSIYCGVLMYGVWEVLTSGVSTGDKVFFVVFIGIVVSAYGAIVFFTWKRWRKERKK